jgi:hypothetical protein
MGIKSAEKFDPFSDRTSRDIRNSLSESLVAALAANDAAGFLDAARRWREQNLSSVYTHYIDDRVQRYQRVLNRIQKERIADPLQQTLVIWNELLFFEVHDHLEALWQNASGDKRQALKGLIKAAGVYVHLEQQHREAAKRLAEKSLRLLRQHAHCLAFIANFETLLDKLRSGDADPPRLKILPGKNNKIASRGSTGAGKEFAC